MIHGAHGPSVSGRPRGVLPSRVARRLVADRRVLRGRARPRRVARARRPREHPLHLLPSEPPARGGAPGALSPDRGERRELSRARRTAAGFAPTPLQRAAAVLAPRAAPTRARGRLPPRADRRSDRAARRPDAVGHGHDRTALGAGDLRRTAELPAAAGEPRRPRDRTRPDRCVQGARDACDAGRRPHRGAVARYLRLDVATRHIRAVARRAARAAPRGARERFEAVARSVRDDTGICTAS
jgi:hypothetical protein